MEYQPSSINVDECFSVQPEINNFLEIPSEKVVSEVLLYRLLNITEVAVRNELNKAGIDSPLVGLRVGYVLVKKENLKDKEREIEEEKNFVSWGLVPDHNNLLELAQNAPEGNTEIDKTIKTQFFEFSDKLVNRLQDTIITKTPGIKREVHRVDAHVAWRTINSIQTSSEGCYLKDDGKWYRRQCSNIGGSEWCWERKCSENQHF